MTETTYHGRCTICGFDGLFHSGDHPSARERHPCPRCGYPQRWRDQAGIILDEFGRGMALSLAELVERGLVDNIDIFEPAMRGPFVQHLKGLPRYVQSYFRPGEPLGETATGGLRNEDMTALTFADDSFDLIISSDVMEHLPGIEKAFAESLRVLRPGGIHLFSIPNDYPLPPRTEPRVAIVDGAEVNIKPAEYHNSGDGTKCLVYTDYGADLTDMIADLGGQLSVVRRSLTQAYSHENATFVLRKVGGMYRPRPRVSVATESVGHICPICGGTEFEEFNGRALARCTICRTVERDRVMFMILDRIDAFAAGKRVLHIAPSALLKRKFTDLSGNDYHAAEVVHRTSRTRSDKASAIDFCADLAAIPDGSYDLILHGHVLQTVPCDIADVLRHLDRILAPGGMHVLSVPFRGETTQEDLSPGLTEDDRRTRFGQVDHVRLFGTRDFPSLLADIWGPGPHLIDPVDIFGLDELRRAAIPVSAWKGISGHSVFHYRKGGRPPAEAIALARKSATS